MRKRYTITIILMVLFFGIAGANASSIQLFEQGMEAFKSGNYGSSELIFRKVVDADDEFRDRAWFYLARSIFNQKKYKSAIFEFNRFLLICATPDLCSESRYWIAEAYFQMKDYIKAIEEYRRFIAKGVNKERIVASYDRIGEIYYNQERYDEAIIEWKKAVTSSDKKTRDNNRIVKIGEAMFQNRKYEEALELLEPLMYSLRDIKTASRARLIVGRSYQLKSNHGKALRIFRSIPDSLLKEYPFYDARYYMALSYLELNEVPTARFYLESFILIAEDSQWYYNAKYHLGDMLVGTKREDEGIELLEEVRRETVNMELKSQASMVLSTLYLEKDPEKAIPYLEDSVSVDDPNTQKDTMLLLANVYLDVNRLEDAERILEYLFSQYTYDEDIDKIQFLLARVYMKQGEVEKALAGFEKIRELNPFSEYLNESSYFLGKAYYEKKDFKKSIELLQSYINSKKASYKYEAYQLMAWAHYNQGNIKKAETIAQLLMKYYYKRDDLDKFLHTFANNIRQTGSGVSRYEDFILSRYPGSSYAGSILVDRGDEKFKAGNYEAAAYYYRKYLETPKREREKSVLLYYMISSYNAGNYRTVVNRLNDADIISESGYTAKQLQILLAKSYYMLEAYKTAYSKFMQIPVNDFNSGDYVMVANAALRQDDTGTVIKIVKNVRSDSEIYAEVLFQLASYYKKIKSHESAMEYFSRLIIDVPGSEKILETRLEMADLYIQEKKYSEAIELVENIAEKEYETRKKAIKILSYFGMGEDARAMDIVNKNLDPILKSSYSEEVLRKCLEYYYLRDDLENVKRYARILARYSGNTNLINYYYARLYIKRKMYKTAYYFYYKVAQDQSEYWEESTYYLGLLSLHVYDNQSRAFGYLENVARKENAENEFVIKSRLLLAILLNEWGKIQRSRELLDTLQSDTVNILTQVKAQNLYEYYGYGKDTK